MHGIYHRFLKVEYESNDSVEFARVSEWLFFNANSAIVKLYHGENKLIFNEMMIRSALY